MMGSSAHARVTGVFAALADDTRADIVLRLAAGDATVGEIARPYAMSLQAVSKHIAVLERAGVVTRGRRGRERPVHLEAKVLDMLDGWLSRARVRAQERYTRLDDVLAGMPADVDPVPNDEERR